jgi:hypothetical protein
MPTLGKTLSNGGTPGSAVTAGDAADELLEVVVPSDDNR